MQRHTPKKFIPKKVFKLDSHLWFWPVFAGVFFGLGYLITKKIYISKSHSLKTINEVQEKKEFLGQRSPLSQGNQTKLNDQNNNGSSNVKKIIFSPSNKDAKIKLTIKYSEILNLKNQAVFKTNHHFFEKETVESLIKTLINQKITKSSKVEAD